ncbi:cytochrome-c peroxidase [Celeribacter indicus]|uniref:Di-heme cytochrome c peroxidase n=1 Tax=Celeribacter indicus TaxID=1208324 RepID=A0A0B5E2J7_9RHOB|nr:cytochrome c peroxidase [Celeribacter indicus]AJE47610.1 di-heme cytochrome c peroxidase [Celeribacter indicus]
MSRALAAALCLAAAPVLAADLSRLSLPRPATEADFLAVDPEEARLGQLLFYDPVLSGNRNISCSTCHHPRFGTSDGLSLGLGEGGVGLGPERVADPANLPEDRVPRNAPALYNLGAREYTRMFHDGRVETVDGHLRVPVEDGFFARVSGILATQAAFPVLSPDEMGGNVNESDLSKAIRKGRFSEQGGAWDIIAQRVAAIPAYRARFEAVYPEIAAGRAIHFADISNAIAAFMAFEFRADDSAFDRYLRGEADLPPEAEAGMRLFYGEAGCAACHSGTFQTDHAFHAMGQVQIGPGKTLDFERGSRDEGRFRVTGHAGDLYAFRTPSLRNVTLTAPYGHAGAYAELRGFLVAHLAPRAAFATYDRAQAVLPDLPVEDWEVMDSEADRAEILAAIAVEDRVLTAPQIDALMAFLAALEDDPDRLGIPDAVPSGLPFEK